MPATHTLTNTHDHLNPDVQRRAYNLFYEYDGTRSGLSWNEVADVLGFQRTTEGGYSVARWAAYQHRDRTGLIARQPRARQQRTQAEQVADLYVSGGLIERRFGIEIEFNRAGGGYYRDMHGLIAATAAALGVRVECEGYNHETRNYWKMTTDATVSGGELVSPPMRTSEGLRQTRLALQAVKQHGGTPGRNQGMHVHHDVTDFTQVQMRRLVTNLRHTERAFMAAVPQCRMNGDNNYAANLMSDRAWDTLAANVDRGSLLPAAVRSRDNRGGGCGVGRYVSVNFNSVLTYGTVEFRGLGNTLNITKIQPWVKVTQALVEFSRIGGVFMERQSTDTMLATLRGANLIDGATKRAFLRIATPTRQAQVAGSPARAA